MMELFLFLACLLGIHALIAKPTLPAESVDSSDIKKKTTDLVGSFKAGEKYAFDELVVLYQTRIYNLALNYVKQTEEARDLTQDIFVTVFKAMHTLNDDSKFVAWLYQIAVNHCRNRYKKLSRRGFFNSLSMDDPDSPLQLASDDQPDRNTEQRDILRVLHDAIGTMNESEREILHLRDVQGISYEEISTMLDIPLGTVKSKLNRARTGLKNKLKSIF